jgi:hypothetical protein
VSGKAFSRLATVSASTKRASVSSGKRGTPPTKLSGLSITPLDPADPSTRGELQERLGLETPFELLSTYVAGTPDIREGDILVVGAVEYPIRAVSDFTAAASMPAYKRLILEQLKR